MNCINKSQYAYQPQLSPVFSDFEKISKPQQTRVPDSFKSTIHTNKSELEIQFNAIQKKQGIIGKSWDSIKNTLHLKNSSNYVKQKIDNYKKGLITEEEVLKSIDKYIKGQTKVLDFVADWGSAIAGATVFTLSLPLFASGVPAALGCAALAGGIFKIGTKKLDAITGNRQYNTIYYDMITGGINGLLSPIANGIGKAVTHATAKGTGAAAAKETMLKALKSGKIQEIINFFALYTKNPVQGEINEGITSKAAGLIIKMASKFGFSILLRESIFKYIESSVKRQEKIINVFLKFNGMDSDTQVQQLYKKSWTLWNQAIPKDNLSNYVYEIDNTKK